MGPYDTLYYMGPTLATSLYHIMYYDGPWKMVHMTSSSVPCLQVPVTSHTLKVHTNTNGPHDKPVQLTYDMNW